MNEFFYWPYDEVSIDAHHPEKLILRTPWIEATTSSMPFNQQNLLALSEKLTQKSLSISDIGLVSDFFQHFRHYPFAYILPTDKNYPSLDHHALIDQSILVTHFESIAGIIMGIEKQADLTYLPRMNFEWDREAALNFAGINNQIHPESLFSIARRYHILELMANDGGNDIFNDMRKLAPDEFKYSVAKLVRQNHYVTELCQEALKPALAHAGQARGIIEDFMRQERGHDKILAKSLLQLGFKPEDIEVSPQTNMLMKTLGFIASRNFLAFAMAIDAFERNNFENVDPTAKLLMDKGYDKAADYINRHMKINDLGNHDNVAVQFLRFMGPCDRDYAHEALMLMEILSLVMCTITKSAYLKPL